MENLIDVYEYDAQGYFSGTTFAQVDDDTREVIAMPPNCTLIKPECNEEFFYKFDGEKWIAEKIPTTAEECVGIVVSHESRTPHDVTMKKLFTTLTKDSQTHRVVHGDNWEWSVEAIPAPTPRGRKVRVGSTSQSTARRVDCRNGLFAYGRLSDQCRTTCRCESLSPSPARCAAARWFSK